MHCLMAGRWLLVLIVLLFPNNTLAETISKQEVEVGLFERQLEMGRYEQLVAIKSQPQSVLSEFTSDGCSGGLSLGWEYLAGKIKNFQVRHGTKPAWELCCIIHDQAYHTAGRREATATESCIARRQADLALKACVVKTGIEQIPELSAEYSISSQEVEILYAAIAALMYRAVRVGGMPCTGLPWRWGYGWPECK